MLWNTFDNTDVMKHLRQHWCYETPSTILMLWNTFDNTDVMKHLRQYWCYGNQSVIGQERWTYRNWGDIGLSPASPEITHTNKQPKNDTKTWGGGQIISSLKKISKHIPRVCSTIIKCPSLTKDAWPLAIWRQRWYDQETDDKRVSDRQINRLPGGCFIGYCRIRNSCVFGSLIGGGIRACFDPFLPCWNLLHAAICWGAHSMQTFCRRRS